MAKLSLSDRVIESRPINLEAAAADVGCLGEMTLHSSAREIDLSQGRLGQLLNVFMTLRDRIFFCQVVRCHGFAELANPMAALYCAVLKKTGRDRYIPIQIRIPSRRNCLWGPLFPIESLRTSCHTSIIIIRPKPAKTGVRCWWIFGAFAEF